MALVSDVRSSTAKTGLEMVVEDPSALVGRRFTHLWRDEIKGDAWWEGECVEQIGGEFLLRYAQNIQDDPFVDVYLETSKIVADMRCGELKLLQSPLQVREKCISCVCC